MAAPIDHRPVDKSPVAEDNPSELLPNGPGAAAILAAGVGSLAIGVFAFAADVSPYMKNVFNFWSPSGPLSGVSFTAVFIWLFVWLLLSRRWAGSRGESRTRERRGIRHADNWIVTHVSTVHGPIAGQVAT